MMAGPQTAGSTSTSTSFSPPHDHAEEDPEHIQQFGPVRGGIVFLETGTPAISRRSTRSGNSLKDGKSGNCDLSDDHDVGGSSEAQLAAPGTRDKTLGGSQMDERVQNHLMCLSDVFKPPVVRQWLSHGRLFRERVERVPSRFELIFDLILVASGFAADSRTTTFKPGIVHQLADAASEHVSGLSLTKVILTFYPAWSIWSDYRNWQNISGVDDVSQRIQTLAILICLVGYSSNASAIELHIVEGGEAASAVARRLLQRAAAAVSSSSAGEGAAIASEISSHGGQQHAVVAATTFFLVAKLIRIVTFLGYAWDMPDFRSAFLARAGALAVVSLIFMGCIWAPSLRATAILAAVGTAVEIASRFSVGVIVSVTRRQWILKAKQRAEDGEMADASKVPIGLGIKMIPAVNLEHTTTKLVARICPVLTVVERTAAFVTIVLGESVISVLFVAKPGTYGLSYQFARAVFGLTVAFIVNAVYFDAALSKKFLHAIRRHWFTNVVWDITHWPLCTGLILASAALAKLVQNEEVSQGIRWQYGGGMGVALLCITVLGILHQSLDPAGASRVNAAFRASVRLVVAIIFALLPLIKSIKDLAFLGIYVGIASAMVIFEVWAKLGVDIVEHEDHRPVEDEEDASLDKGPEDAGGSDLMHAPH
ncbi:BQ2448_8075 [Microbotryum intermedium]|uniref:BQ2448_8075 protein n=1 Tax=Microbotryum intermedium TaxID=269621 RepID=A0A238FTM2_9BASI|nr:BQ2448_8075 [Microbotryum intermedium]